MAPNRSGPPKRGTGRVDNSAQLAATLLRTVLDALANLSSEDSDVRWEAAARLRQLSPSECGAIMPGAKQFHPRVLGLITAGDDFTKVTCLSILSGMVEAGAFPTAIAALTWRQAQCAVGASSRVGGAQAGFSRRRRCSRW